MSKLTNELKSALEAAADPTVSAEALSVDLAASIVDRDQVSFEQATADLIALEGVGEQAQRLIAALESMDGPESPTVATLAQLAADNIFSQVHLQVGAVSLEDAVGGDKAARLKEVIAKLWDAIKRAAVKVWRFLVQMFKSLTDAEKALYVETVRLKTEVRGLVQAGKITRNPIVKFGQGTQWISDKGQMPATGAELLAHLSAYRSFHNAFHTSYAGAISKAMINCGQAVGHVRDGKSLTQAVIETRVAVGVMNPENIARVLGPNVEHEGNAYHVYLTHDRRLTVEGPRLPSSRDDSFPEAVKQVQIRVEQFEIAAQADDDAGMKAMQESEMLAILDMVEIILANGTRTDSFKRFAGLLPAADGFQQRLDAMVEAIDKLPAEQITTDEHGHTTKDLLQEVIRTNQLFTRWAAAPYAKVDTITVHLVRAVLRVINAHVANYRDETPDPAVVKSEGKDKDKDKA